MASENPHAVPVPPLLEAGPVRRARARRGVLVTLAGLALVVGWFVLHEFPPDQSRFYPKCGFHLMTGLDCAGCGSTRALHHLTHGRVLEAVRANAMLVAGVVWGLVWLGVRVGRRIRGVPAEGGGASGRWVSWLLVGVVVFTAVRNLPWAPFTWLRP